MGDVFRSGQDGERLEGVNGGEIGVGEELEWWLRMEFVVGLLSRRLEGFTCNGSTQGLACFLPIEVWRRSDMYLPTRLTSIEKRRMKYVRCAF